MIFQLQNNPLYLADAEVFDAEATIVPAGHMIIPHKIFKKFTVVAIARKIKLQDSGVLVFIFRFALS